MKVFLTYFYPVLSALVACFLTYLFTIRSKKHDIILHERLSAFKAIHKELVILKTYCHSKAFEGTGNDFAPRYYMFNNTVNKGALTHFKNLNKVVDENLIFLPSKSKESLNDVFSCISIVSNIEEQMASPDPPQEIILTATDAYTNTIEKIDKCLDNLFSELKLPK